MLPRVAVVGLGGLGAPAAAALAETGAALSLFDPDRVELSNLPRQPLYDRADVGRPKATRAGERLGLRLPGLSVRTHPIAIDRDNGIGLLREHRVIIDATDGLETKVLLNKLALELACPLVHAGAVGLDGQLMTIRPYETACLRCLFVELPSEDELPTCQQAGILGPVVGAVGLAAAREALALLHGRHAPLENRLAIFDGAKMSWRRVELRRNVRCPACADRVGPK